MAGTVRGEIMGYSVTRVRCEFSWEKVIKADKGKEGRQTEIE